MVHLQLRLLRPGRLAAILVAILALLLFSSPAEAQCQFIRGDLDSSGNVDLNDAVDILAFLFIGETVPECLDAADTNDNGLVELADYIYIARWLFDNGPPPPAPFPQKGADPTPGISVPEARDARFTFKIGASIGHASNTGLHVPLMISNDVDVHGFQMVFEYDGNLLRIDEMLVGKTALEDADAEYVIHQFFNRPGVSHAGLSALVDFATPVRFRVLPAGQDQLVGEVVFAIAVTANPQITALRFVDGVKFPDDDPPEKLAPVHNLVMLNTTVVRPNLVDGSIEIRKAFIRGDSNQDKRVDIADSVFSLAYLFLGGEIPKCEDASDVNNDGRIDLSDPVFLLQYLFRGGPQPSSPFPAPGVDPDNDQLGCEI